jgi:hypothetical protein
MAQLGRLGLPEEGPVVGVKLPRRIRSGLIKLVQNLLSLHGKVL